MANKILKYIETSRSVKIYSREDVCKTSLLTFMEEQKKYIGFQDALELVQQFVERRKIEIYYGYKINEYMKQMDNASTILINRVQNGKCLNILKSRNIDKVKIIKSGTKYNAQAKHNGLKCSYCKKCFLYRSTMIIHERTHNGKKPYQCAVCQKGFSRTDNLLVHQKIHERIRP